MSPRLEACAECQQWSERYHELVKELIAMKRDGFVPQAQMPDMQPIAQLEPEIEAAITETVGSKGPIASEQRGIAWALKRSGKAPEEIATLIRQGEPLSL